MRTILTAVLGLVLVVTAHGQTAGGRNRSHLVPGMTCTTCHVSEVPTKENPSVRSCPRTQIATVQHSAEEGPDVVIMKTLSDSASLYVPVRFLHKGHAEMSEMAGGCTMCHHYNPPGRVLGCIECHEVARQRENLGRPDLKAAYHRQCLDCHRRWSTDTGCRSCHALRSEAQLRAAQSDKKRNLGRRHPIVSKPARLVLESSYDQGRLVTFYHNEHVDRFGLECSQCHTSESCIRCHEKGKNASAQLVTVEQGHQACERCHNTNERCDRCHGGEPKPGFDHRRRSGWPLRQFHDRLDCNRCHVRQNVFAGLSGACTSCHSAWTPESFRHAVTGLALDQNHTGLTCDVCHTDDRFVAAPSCEGCHDQFSYPKRLPGKRVKRYALVKG